MRSSAVRLTLTLLAAGAIAAAAYLVWAAEQRSLHARDSSAAFEHARLGAIRDTLELRAAQQAYVAAGQSEAFWIAKVTASIDALRASLSTLAERPFASSVSGALQQAAEALQDFEQVDRRARGYASTGQKLLASDIIFSDGLDTTTRLLAALDQAGEARQQLGAVTRAARRDQAIAASGAGAVMLIALLLLTPRPKDDSPAASAPERVRAAAPADELELRPSANAPAAPSPAPSGPAARSVDIERLARVCAELAQLADSNELPVVLERAAEALDASGLVLWGADPDGKELVPVAAHGYTPGVVSRMGTLRADAENATAAAFRTGLVQTVRSDDASNGAIAAPLVTANGSRGVMSVEVRHEGEQQATRLAAASIVAAQLATLVGPPAARSQERSAAL